VAFRPGRGVHRSCGLRVGGMCTGGALDDLRQTLRVQVDAVELGHWRVILHPQAARVAGPRRLVMGGVVLQMVARSMQLQAQGRVHDAWDLLGKAATLLPSVRRRLIGSGEFAVAVLRPPRDASVDEELAWRITRLVWREQFELSHLRELFASGQLKARGELVEACIESLCWIDFDPFVCLRRSPGAPAWDDGVSVDRERSTLCLRGTRLRNFANGANRKPISKSVWEDIGGYRGLCAEAFDRLADRPAPAPWCGTAGASDLKVRLGRLRAWEHANQWRADVDHWR
jgi:hypothetical protein